MTGSVHFRAIGVDCRIVMTGDAEPEAVRELAEARLAQLDAVASRFRPDSEVRRLATRAAPAGTRIVTAPASSLLRALLDDALWAAGATDGLVDPTLGRAMEEAGYDADLAVVLARTTGATPVGTGGDVMNTIEHQASSLPDLHVDEAAGTVSVAVGTLLDLGATAKAATADRIAAELAARWPGGFLVELGGDIAVGGEPPIDGWVIAADDETCSGPDRIVITTQGVATSGTDRRRWYVDGVLRHHLLDPATGQSVSATWLQVTCVGVSALEANTASTAACVLGDAAVEWLTERGIAARLVREPGRTIRTPGWPGALRERAS